MSRQLIVDIHSIFGALVFLIGVLQIILKKGGKIHRYLGLSYLAAWVVLLITGSYIGSMFITVVGIFGYYFALTGARLGRRKNEPFQKLDKAIIIGGLLANISMFYSAIGLFLKGDQSFGIVFTVFGFLFALATVEDFFRYILLKPIKKNKYGNMYWYFEHLTRMYISFIAALTAYTSIQNVFGENTLNFLMPTAFGIIGIEASKRYFKKKLKIK